MSKLTCHVTSCASNQNCCCCQPAIKVQGRGACRCSETECQSFHKKGTGEISNATQFSHPNPDCMIKCTAEHCVYNTQGSCTPSRWTSADTAHRSAVKPAAKAFAQIGLIDKKHSAFDLEGYRIKGTPHLLENRWGVFR